MVELHRQEVILSSGASRHLDSMLQLLLEIVRDVIAVGNVPDARQRYTGHESFREAWEPAHRNRCHGLAQTWHYIACTCLTRAVSFR